MEKEKAYKSLLGCMIGTISNIDLYVIKKRIKDMGEVTLQSYYNMSIDAHCSMTIFEELDIQ